MEGSLTFFKSLINKQSMTILISLVGSTSIAYLVYKYKKNQNAELEE
jgi:hypothetical protein